MEIPVLDFHNPELGSCDASGADMNRWESHSGKRQVWADLADGSELELMIPHGSDFAYHPIGMLYCSALGTCFNVSWHLCILQTAPESPSRQSGRGGQNRAAFLPKPIGRRGSADTLPCPDHLPSTRRNQTMNDYQVTFANGEVVEVEAWMPEIARVIAEEEADLNGRPLSVVSVELLGLQPTEG